MPDLPASLQDVLGDRYQLEGELGRGGMGTVYRGFDRKHQRPVAVKVLNADIASTVAGERFQREIAIASALLHPNIVPLYDSGGDGDLRYYIMPLVGGESLRDRLEREHQLPFEDALRIAREVADALGYAHAQGIVHRDVKPENVLLAGGRAMVADFGIARAIEVSAGTHLTLPGTGIGTPAYMSPEQAEGSPSVDGRADLYALGCVLFEMLAGQPPFTGRTAQAIIARQMQERPPSLQIVRSTVPLGVQQVVERLLEKVPADRYATAAQFQAALTDALTRPSAALPVSRPRTRRWVAPAVLVGLLGAGLGLWRIAARPPAPDFRRVVVFPLSAPGGGAEGLGEQVSLMIGSALEHTQPLKFIDGSRLVEGGDASHLTARAAARIARQAAAGYYVDGAILRIGDSIRVILRLNASSDSLVHQESAGDLASAAGAPTLGLRAVARLLPRLVGASGHVDLSYLTDRNPAAIADWLQGEREYARAQYQAAMVHMDSALAADSTMAVAALKGAQAATYLEDYPTARRMVAVAERYAAQLPAHHLALARGLDRYLRGEADSAAVFFRAARAADSSWPEPWMGLGETYYHLMPSVDDPDSAAEDAFARAVQLDPRFGPALFHLAELAARRGETARARGLAATFRGVSPDSDWVFQLDLTVRCAADGPQAIDWRAAVARMSDRVVNVARVLGAGARYPACSRRALESVLDFDTSAAPEHAIFRWSALKGLNYEAMAAGMSGWVTVLLDSAQSHGMPAAASLAVLDAAAGAGFLEQRAELAMASLAMPIAQMRAVRLRYFGLWADHRRDLPRLDSIIAAIHAVTDTAHGASDRQLAGAFEARRALLHGDTASAIRLLRGLRPVAEVGPLTWDLWASLAGERLLLARLLLARGEPAEALRIAELFDSPRSQVHLLYLPASLSIRADAADRLGLPSRRNAYRGRLQALRPGRT